MTDRSCPTGAIPDNAYVVVFISTLRHNVDNKTYEDIAKRMAGLARNQPGFLALRTAATLRQALE